MSTLKVNQITDLNNAEIYEPNLMTAVSASGTSVDFTSIPSWVKRITVIFNGVSTNGTSIPIVQLGDSGGIETTSYTASATVLTSGVASANFTTGMGLAGQWVASVIAYGTLQLVNISGNTWVASGNLGRSDFAGTYLFGGSKTLSDTLTQIRITTVNGTDTFDAGTINVMYE
jgi:hypothetical protein